MNEHDVISSQHNSTVKIQIRVDGSTHFRSKNSVSKSFTSIYFNLRDFLGFEQ